MSVFEDLKQRKIFQWAAVYLAGAWLLMQLTDVLGTRWGLSENDARVVDIVLITGFFVTLVVAWYHGDQGRQRVSSVELLIIAGLCSVGALGLVLLDTGQGAGSLIDNVAEAATSVNEEPWLVVLPFRIQTEDPELRNFADGLTENISNGLSDFSYLLVLSRNAVSGMDTGEVDIRQVGRELGARYVLQGTLRQTDSITRISVQLVDARNGTQIWTESFDRELTSGDLLMIQDELTDRIVATVADPAGIVVRTLVAPTDSKAVDELTPYEAALRYFLFQQRLSSADHLITRVALEHAVEIDPGCAEAWTSLSLIYQQEYMNNLNPQPNSLQRALEAAERAVDLVPLSARAHFAMAQARYFMKDIGSFHVHAERAIELNPRNTDTLAMVGTMMGYSGDWERSVEVTTRAMQLNPNHAGWYYFNTFFNEYRQQHYVEALAIARKINMPEYWATHLALVISNAQLGNRAEAVAAVDELLRTWPDFEEEYSQSGMVKWIIGQPSLIELINEGLRKAGIEVSISTP